MRSPADLRPLRCRVDRRFAASRVSAANGRSTRDRTVYPQVSTARRRRGADAGYERKKTPPDFPRGRPAGRPRARHRFVRGDGACTPTRSPTRSSIRECHRSVPPHAAPAVPCAIEACAACIRRCEACAARASRRVRAAMVDCIRLIAIAPKLCPALRICGRQRPARGTPRPRGAGDACATECEKHATMAEHCRRAEAAACCATACRTSSESW